jgi:hypothetical protein
MSLRKRPVSADRSSQEKLTQAKDQPPAPSKFSGALYIFFGALGLSTLLFFASNLSSSFGTTGSVDYLAPYALCASDPTQIYTVDAQNARTQCILVENGYVLNTGTLGASSELSSPSRRTISGKLQWRSSSTGTVSKVKALPIPSCKPTTSPRDQLWSPA